MSLRLDFVAVGPQRTATTWVYEYLRRHPGAAVSGRVKESNFFDRHFDRGPEWYARLFPPDEPGRAVGEVGSTYFHSDTALANIRAHSPGARVVVTLREPFGRLVSLHRHMQQQGGIPPGTTLADALATEPHLIETSRYATHTRRWREAFGADRVTVLLYEDLAADPEAFARRLCAAVGVEAVPLPAELRAPMNEATQPRSHAVAVWAARANATLRRAGLHRVVAAAKRGGLHRLLASGPAARAAVPGPLAAEVFAELRDEFEGVAAVAGLDLAPWRAEWARLGLPA